MTFKSAKKVLKEINHCTNSFLSLMNFANLHIHLTPRLQSFKLVHRRHPSFILYNNLVIHCCFSYQSFLNIVY